MLYFLLLIHLCEWDLFQKFKDSRHVEFFGTGKESRDYIHIDDICQQVELVIQNATFNGEAYNIANGSQIRISELAKLIKDNTQFRGEIIFNGNVRIGDPLNWEADISKIKKWGYTQSISINEGLELYTKWVKENG